MSELLGEGVEQGGLELTVTDLHETVGNSSPNFEEPMEELTGLPRNRLVQERAGSPGSINEFYFQIYSRNVESFLQEFLMNLQEQEVGVGYSGTPYFVPPEEGFVYSQKDERYIGSVLFMDRESMLDAELDGLLYDANGDYLDEEAAPSAYGLPEESYSPVHDVSKMRGYVPAYLNIYMLDDNTIGVELGLAPLESSYDSGRSLGALTDSTGLDALALKQLIVEGTLDQVLRQNPGLSAELEEVGADQLLGLEESPYQIETEDEFRQRDLEENAPDAVSVIPSDIGQDPYVEPAEAKRDLREDRFTTLNYIL